VSGLYYKWHDGQGWNELGFVSINEMMTVLRDLGIAAKIAGIQVQTPLESIPDAVVSDGRVSFGSIDGGEKSVAPGTQCFHNRFDTEHDRCLECGKTSQEIRDMMGQKPGFEEPK